MACHLAVLSISTLRSAEPFGSSVSVQDERNHHGGHSGSGCRMNAQGCVLKNQAILRSYAKSLGSNKEWVRGRFGILVVFRRHDGIEFVEQIEDRQGADDRFSTAA